MAKFEKKEIVINHIKDKTLKRLKNISNRDLFFDEDVALAILLPTQGLPRWSNLEAFIEYAEYPSFKNPLRQSQHFLKSCIEGISNITVNEKCAGQNALMSIINIFDRSVWDNEDTLTSIMSLSFENLVYAFNFNPHLGISITPKMTEASVNALISFKDYGLNAIENNKEFINFLGKDNILKFYKEGIDFSWAIVDYSKVSENDMLEAVRNFVSNTIFENPYPILGWYFADENGNKPSSKDVAKECIKASSCIITANAFKEYQEDINFLLEVLEDTPSVYNFLSDSLKANYDIAYKTVSQGYQSPISFKDENGNFPNAKYPLLLAYVQNPNISGNDLRFVLNCNKDLPLTDAEILNLCKTAVGNNSENIYCVPKEILLKGFNAIC